MLAQASKIILTLLVVSNEFIFIGCSQKLEHEKTTTNDASLKLSLQRSLYLPSDSYSSTPPMDAPKDSGQGDHGGPLKLQLRHEIFTDDQMELLYRFLDDSHWLEDDSERMTISELGLVLLLTRFHALLYDDMLLHRYDSYEELKQSTGPHVDQELCLAQLEQMNRRADRMEEQQFDSTDLNLHRLLDTFGRVPPGLIAGNLVWPGKYKICLHMKIDSPEGKAPTRYCLASIKHNTWPRHNQLSRITSFEAGICLPRTCDSLRYKNKYELIERLMDFNARRVDKNQTFLNDLYCLPDEDSPMRMWWRSPRTLQAVIVFGIWFAVLIYATIRYELLNRLHKMAGGSCRDKSADNDATNGISDRVSTKNSSCFEVYRMLAITANFKSLFTTTAKPANPNDNSGSTAEVYKQAPVVDLRCLDGIKVISMAYVVTGHVFMSFAGVVSNMREQAAWPTPAYLMSNMIPAFAVNAFFTITGMLMSYLLFKKDNKSLSIMTSPSKWAYLITYRYLRIMPLYLVVVYYCKYISKFTGSGPMWDYGTSWLAHRHRCEEEPWIWTILFRANFHPIHDQCIPSAWYLADDFQFLLVTPIFLFALHKSPAFGQRLLKFCVAIGYLAGIVAMILVDSPDTRPLVKSMVHSHKTHVNFFEPTYTRPYYRIPAYLCGLLFGYQLYVFESDRLKYLASRKATVGKKETRAAHDPAPPNWSWWFLNYGSWLSLVLILAGALVPITGSQPEYSKLGAHLMNAIGSSSFHLMFALAFGLYIQLATTGNGNKFFNDFLSAPFWKPLARLNLCVLLINIEVIKYIMQTHTQKLETDFYTHTSLNLLTIVSCYLMAIFVYVLFEAPIRGLVNRILFRQTYQAVQERKMD